MKLGGNVQPSVHLDFYAVSPISSSAIAQRTFRVIFALHSTLPPAANCFRRIAVDIITLRSAEIYNYILNISLIDTIFL